MPSHQERRHARYKPCERGEAPHKWYPDPIWDMRARIAESFNKRVDKCAECPATRLVDIVPEPVS